MAENPVGFQINDSNMIDESSLGLSNNGFKPYDANLLTGDGFGFNESNVSVSRRTVDNEIIGLMPSGYQIGDVINSGYARTLGTIAHRNNILRTGVLGIGLYPDTNHFHIPKGDDELLEFEKCISALREWAKSDDGLGDVNYYKWETLYYPAFSAAYAYQPSVVKGVEVLNDKFHKHNWFVPSIGLMIRLFYFMFDTSITSRPPTRTSGYFAEHIKSGLLKPFNPNNGQIDAITSSTPYLSYQYHALAAYSNSTTIASKITSRQVWVACAF
jgi:hypothetical protein